MRSAWFQIFVWTNLLCDFETRSPKPVWRQSGKSSGSVFSISEIAGLLLSTHALCKHDFEPANCLSVKDLCKLWHHLFSWHLWMRLSLRQFSLLSTHMLCVNLLHECLLCNTTHDCLLYTSEGYGSIRDKQRHCFWRRGNLPLHLSKSCQFVAWLLSRPFEIWSWKWHTHAKHASSQE